MRCTVLACAFAAHAVVQGIAAAPPVITWLSEPLQPSETLLVSGGGLDESCVAYFSTTSADVPPSSLSAPAIANYSTSYSAMFITPADLPADVYSLRISCSGGSSTPVLVNAAQPWWCQGDLGERASPGGWLRISGLNVAWLSDEQLRSRAAERSAARMLRAAPPLSAAFDAALTALLHARGSARDAAPGTVRLTPLAGGQSVDLTPISSNATQWSVYVPVPVSLTPGEYNVSVSNGRGAGAGGTFTPLDSFYDPAAPHVTSIIIAQPPAWAPGVFVVNTTSLPSNWPFNESVTSDSAVADALAAARAAGGGTVRFPPGTYFLSQPLIVPPGVALRGAGADATALYFAEATNATAPAAYFALDDAAAGAAPGGVGAWAVSDLAVIITGFHWHVFEVSNFSDGFALERVTLRANAFFAGNKAGTFGVQTHGRYANWTLDAPGAGVMLNAKNFRIASALFPPSPLSHSTLVRFRRRQIQNTTPHTVHALSHLDHQTVICGRHTMQSRHLGAAGRSRVTAVR